MSIRMKDLVHRLTKDQERIVAAEFDKRHPDTGIFSFTTHAKCQFILRGYNQHDLAQMKQVITLETVPLDGQEHVIISTSLHYGLACQRYRNKITVITVLERFRTKTEDNKIIVEGVERDIIWTR